jgi:hypothetical protein
MTAALAIFAQFLALGLQCLLLKAKKLMILQIGVHYQWYLYLQHCSLC